MLPETAILGGFALAIYHFISEITDCTQRQKIPAHARLVPGRRCFLPAPCCAMFSTKIDSRDGEMISIANFSLWL